MLSLIDCDLRKFIILSELYMLLAEMAYDYPKGFVAFIHVSDCNMHNIDTVHINSYVLVHLYSVHVMLIYITKAYTKLTIISIKITIYHHRSLVRRPRSLRIGYGSTRLSQLDYVRASRISVHPDYNSTNGMLYYNDNFWNP